MGGKGRSQEPVSYTHLDVYKRQVYKEFQDKKLSALGFGAMRLPVSDSIPGTPIDEEKTRCV